MNKKGQIDEIGQLIVALVAISIILAVGFLIFAQTKDVVLDKISASTIINETVAGSDNTSSAYIPLAKSPSALTLGCGAVYNGSGPTLISPSLYTCTPGLGINMTGPQNWSGHNLNVTYSYKLADVAYNATGEVQNATQSIPGWLPIIVITLIGAILIGLVSMFRNR